MFKQKNAVILAALATVSHMAYAEESPAKEIYIGADYGFFGYDADDVASDYEMFPMIFRAGYVVNRFVALELRAGLGTSSQSATELSGHTRVGLDHFYGAHVKFTAPVSDAIAPYVSLGVSRVDLQYTRGTLDVSESGSDASFGFGFDMKANDSFSFNFEYSDVYSRKGVEISGVMFGVSYTL